MHILTLDNDVHVSTLYHTMLTTLGHTVVMCHNLSDAKKQDPDKFDLAILDHYLDDGEHGETLAIHWRDKMEFIICTGTSSIKDIRILSQYGDVVGKTSVSQSHTDFLSEFEETILRIEQRIKDRERNRNIIATENSTINITINEAND